MFGFEALQLKYYNLSVLSSLHIKRRLPNWLLRFPILKVWFTFIYPLVPSLGNVNGRRALVARGIPIPILEKQIPVSVELACKLSKKSIQVVYCTVTNYICRDSKRCIITMKGKQENNQFKNSQLNSFLHWKAVIGSSLVWANYSEDFNPLTQFSVNKSTNSYESVFMLFV